MMGVETKGRNIRDVRQCHAPRVRVRARRGGKMSPIRGRMAEVRKTRYGRRPRRRERTREGRNEGSGNGERGGGTHLALRRSDCTRQESHNDLYTELANDGCNQPGDYDTHADRRGEWTLRSIKRRCPPVG